MKPVAVGGPLSAEDLLRQFFEASVAQTGGSPVKTGNGWNLRCPAHDDKNPSLSVNIGRENDRLLVHCHAGCAPEDVTGALGWEMKDLWVEERKAPEPVVRRVEKRPPAKASRTVYTYVDEAERPLFEVVVERHPNGDKKVRQHAIKPDGSQAASLGNVRRVLYRLPAVLNAVRNLSPVFLVEGEKCVHAMESLGLVATTNPMGAGKWSEAYSETLRDANVYVLPDNDEPGEKHAQAVVEALNGIARNARIVRLPGLPAGGDIADWVLSGGTREEFLAVVRATQPMTGVRALPPASTHPIPELDPAARHGVFGRALDLLEPSTEAEPVAILASLMIGFGIMCGPGPHTTRGPEKFPAKDFALIVGASAKARKGTSWSITKHLLERVDNDFFSAKNLRLVTGLSTGEGLIARVRDDRAELGTTHDPRLLAIEPEWAKILRVGDRQGNNLSGVLREAWDLGPLATATKADPVSASVHHIGLLGHITVDEMLSEVSTVAIRNGFMNRHLLVYVRRQKLLSNPPELDDNAVGLLASEMREALELARTRKAVPLSREAAHMWTSMYAEVESRDPLGVVGDLTSRASAHILRLALIYALGDGAAQVGPEHLTAARALWDYSEASVTFIYGDRLSDPVAQRLLEALRAAGVEGLPARKQFEVLGGNVNAERREAAVRLLVRMGLAHEVASEPGPKGGRPSVVLYPGSAPLPS